MQVLLQYETRKKVEFFSAKGRLFSIFDALCRKLFEFGKNYHISCLVFVKFFGILDIAKIGKMW